MSKFHKGACTYDVCKFFGFFDPLPPPPPPCLLFHATSLTKLPYCICSWGTPSPPPRADIICTCPLMVCQSWWPRLLDIRDKKKPSGVACWDACPNVNHQFIGRACQRKVGYHRNKMFYREWVIWGESILEVYKVSHSLTSCSRSCYYTSYGSYTNPLSYEVW